MTSYELTKLKKRLLKAQPKKGFLQKKMKAVLNLLIFYKILKNAKKSK